VVVLDGGYVKKDRDPSPTSGFRRAFDQLFVGRELVKCANEKPGALERPEISFEWPVVLEESHRDPARSKVSSSIRSRR
jgi:hypothetical protein